MRKTRFIAAAASVAALAIAAPAQAADQIVTGSVGDVFAVTADPAVTLSNFGPGSAATGSGSVTLTSTSATTPHTLSIQDGTSANTVWNTLFPGHAAGRMDNITGTAVSSVATAALGPAQLASPIQWSLTAGSGYVNLLGSAAALGAPVSALTSTKTVYFNQPIGDTEAVRLGDEYGIVITYTAT